MDLELFGKQLTTKKLGRKVIYLEETESTNRYADKLFEHENLSHGAVVIADRQTAGKGRLERSWHSEGGLAMTVVLEFPAQNQAVSPVTLTAGAACAIAITNLTGTRFGVKYPNDVMHEGKKLGGILSEMKTRGKTFVLLGIGINVEQDSFPEEIADIAVSLKQLEIIKKREEVAAAILNELEPLAELFIAEGFHRVRPFWLDANCTIGKTFIVKKPDGDVEGKAINIDDAGALVIETPGGVEKVTTGDFVLKD